MSEKYSVILWNVQKKRYDLVLWLAIVLLIMSFIGSQLLMHPTITIETLIIRASSVSAFFLLHVILSIGPLCRLNVKFLPLLYNRRHMGVSMFLLAAIHGIFCIIQFHTLGDINPIASIFMSNENYSSISEFPFQILGFVALIILFIMAATSHDFWLKNLSPKVWKSLHMLVYLAYGLIIVHVASGVLQQESSNSYWLLLVFGFTVIVMLHLAAAIKETRKLNTSFDLSEKGFYKICSVDEIPTDCGKSVFVNGENIAIFRYNGLVSAVHNVCKHQMGPIGEGKVIDGCITCPWHGYQYYPGNGQSPPPFTEKLKTYKTSVQDGFVWVDPVPLPEGTEIKPSIL